VIESAKNLYVRNSLGDLSAAKVERISKTDDLAILVLTSAFPSDRAVTPSRFGAARTGSNIAVIGFPLTDVLGSMTPSITNGIVIKVTGMGDSPDSFQVSAKMNKGNSGGAVFDTYGRLVGIAVGKLDTVKMLQGSGFLPEDINFAIHVDRLRAIGLSVVPGPRSPREMSLEDLYQQSIGSVVLVAGEAK
jgi:S1-C subfamily serine protease